MARARLLLPNALYTMAGTALLLALGSSALAAGTDSEDGTSVAAVVDGRTITVDALDAWIKEDLFRREMGSRSPSRLYEVRSEAIQRMVDEQVFESEAAKRGLDPGAFLEKEIEALGPVSDEEIEKFYQQNQEKLKSDVDPEELKSRIRIHLERQRPGEAIAKVRSNASVAIELEPPRASIAGSGPSRGPADAPIVIIEFSDYQCPFCRRAEPTLNELVKRYPKDVRWEYRHFPLGNHAEARPAAEAAVCAEAQGKFWEYHDLLFSQKRSLDDAGLRGYAEDLGLDLARFDSCRKAPGTRERVEADMQAGRRAGASGTPAFFVNGVFMNGARPIEDFEAVIRAELARRSASEAASGS